MLRTILYKGEWWAPFRTAALRDSAAAALRRLGSPEARGLLQEAAANGGRGVRNVAKRYLSSAPRGHA
jgi:HEAT repeat protein